MWWGTYCSCNKMHPATTQKQHYITATQPWRLAQWGGDNTLLNSQAVDDNKSHITSLSTTKPVLSDKRHPSMSLEYTKVFVLCGFRMSECITSITKNFIMWDKNYCNTTLPGHSRSRKYRENILEEKESPYTVTVSSLDTQEAKNISSCVL